MQFRPRQAGTTALQAAYRNRDRIVALLLTGYGDRAALASLYGVAEAVVEGLSRVEEVGRGSRRDPIAAGKTGGTNDE
jgi:hypothetical protein